MLFKKNKLDQDQRRYIRLDTVFPIEVRILSLDGGSSLSEGLQGFTRNISEGGICLEISGLTAELLSLIKAKQVKMYLKMDFPVLKNPVDALAQIAWVSNEPDNPNRYSIGLRYEKIDPLLANKIISYVYLKKAIFPLFTAAIIVSVIVIAGNAYINAKLARNNKKLVQQYVQVIREIDSARQFISRIGKDKTQLEEKIKVSEISIDTLVKEKNALMEKLEAQESGGPEKIAKLRGSIEKLMFEKAELLQALSLLGKKEDKFHEALVSLDKKRSVLEKANFDKMYHWLKVHQNPRTGLVMSFEGDKNIAEWGFVYDQSLAAQGYALFGDFERAKKLLDFFSRKAKKDQNNLFYNSYYVDDSEPAEYIVHSGPNIWLGIAILQYAKKSKDFSHLLVAEQIARGIMKIQEQDKDGGLRGGPEVKWYSSEHNLDAYAFFDMLYGVTGNIRYAQARDKTFAWLTKHTYDSRDVPVKRGKGDATIATDTYAWSIAAIGPEKLKKAGMDPDKIMGFAEQNCAVQVKYLRPEGNVVSVKGFDFAPQRHVARGGIVSPEWTAQMVVSFNIMADFYRKNNTSDKVSIYEAKAKEYLANLAQMIISSPSPSGQGDSCLPYASAQNADTGHGWATPQGSSTGSVAGTAYTIFAYYNYNPLQIDNKQ